MVGLGVRLDKKLLPSHTYALYSLEITGFPMKEKKKYIIPSDSEILSIYNDRFFLMRGARSQFEAERKLCEDQFNAETTSDNDGNINTNIPLEKTLIENSMGRLAGKLNFEIVPEAEADVQELQSAKYTLEHFMDDSEQQYNFYVEKRHAEMDCQKYGTSVMFTGLSHTKEIIYELSDEASNFYDESYNEIQIDKWCFIPRNVPLRNFRVDYSALWQSDFRKAKFCVMQETDTPDNLRLKREGNPWFKNLDRITPFINLFPAYLKVNIRPDEAMVHYYFDKITKDYWIIVNRSIVVYAGKMLYAHGQLPFDMRQYYQTTSQLYGEWQPHRVRSMKAFKNSIMDATIKRVQMTSGINIALFGNQPAPWDLYTASGEMNIWQFAQWQDSVKQFQLDGNISSQSGLLTIIDDQIIQDSGENLKAPYSSPAWTATEIEVIEENKATRQKCIDEVRDQSRQNILTQVLKNIAQFAPALLKKEIKKKIGKKEVVAKIEYPMIRIPHMTINKKNKKWESMFVEDYGKYGFFELKPKTIRGDLTVKIVTPNTKSGLKTLEKNAITQYIGNMNTLALMSPEMAQEVVKRMKDWGIFDWMDLTYGYDNKLNASTKKDEIKQKNLKALDELKQSLGLWAEWLPMPSGSPLPEALPWATPNQQLLANTDTQNAEAVKWWNAIPVGWEPATPAPEL